MIATRLTGATDINIAIKSGFIYLFSKITMCLDIQHYNNVKVSQCTPRRQRGNGGTDPLILNLDCR